jgi:hypothetical protein
VRDAVWGHERASRIIRVAEKDQPRLALLENRRDCLRHHTKTLGTPGAVLMQAGTHEDSGTRVLAEGGAHQQHRVARAHKRQRHEPDEFGTAIANEELIYGHVQMHCQLTAKGQGLPIRVAVVGHLGQGLAHAW